MGHNPQDMGYCRSARSQGAAPGGSFVFALGGDRDAGAQGDQLLAHLYLSTGGNVAVRETHAFREGTDHNDRRVIACGLNRGPV